MKTVLITGATGNVGLEVIKSLHKQTHRLNIIAGVRSVEKDKKELVEYGVSFRGLDFTDVKSYKPALENCNILFLLRPPNIANVQKYFKPLIDTAAESGIEHIVFLSVQGVENSKIIPHYKIEQLIARSNIPYTFLRPSYFMQNFSTTLLSDLVNKRRIFLPAGSSKFTLIDVRDVGVVAANILSDSNNHINKSYELTANEKLTFKQMAEKLSTGLKTKIDYQSPNLLHFYFVKRSEKVTRMFILVMILLHYFTRFQKEPQITNWVERFTGRKPITFDQFIKDNKTLLTQSTGNID